MKENEIKKIESEIEKLQKKKEELIKLEEAKDFKEITYKGKTLRIYKWENKKFGDFPMPKGFDFCEFNDFIELYDNDLVEMKPYEYFFMKHYSKKQQKKKWNFVWLCIDRNLGLGSDYGCLADSATDGKVVISK